MKKLLLSLLFLFSTALCFGNGVQVDSISYSVISKKISFHLSWQNAWRQTINYHDAVWIFCKYRTVNTGKWLHADVKAGTTATSGLLETFESPDKLGFFVRLNVDTTGHIFPTAVSFEAENLVGVFPEFKVFAIEMVYVPQGRFFAGAPQLDTGRNSSFFATNNFEDQVLFRKVQFLGNKHLPIEIGSEDAMQPTVGLTFPKRFHIPATFPKGFRAFYAMKHEISNAQLASFLNSIPRNWIDQFELALPPFDAGPQGIIYQLPIYSELSPATNSFVEYGSLSAKLDTPSLTLSFGADYNRNGIFDETDDGTDYPAYMANGLFFNYLYWAGLAPMTELQFEKSCRGPLFPELNEKAWGSSEMNVIPFAQMQNKREQNERLASPVVAPVSELFTRCGAFADSNTNRLTSGASFYGILNYQDNVAEITVAADSSNLLFDGISQKTDQYLNPADKGIMIRTIRGGANVNRNAFVNLGYPIYRRNYYSAFNTKSGELNYKITLPNNERSFSEYNQFGGRGVKNLQ